MFPKKISISGSTEIFIIGIKKILLFTIKKNIRKKINLEYPSKPQYLKNSIVPVFPLMSQYKCIYLFIIILYFVLIHLKVSVFQTLNFVVHSTYLNMYNNIYVSS